jgi:hypothetical protein
MEAVLAVVIVGIEINDDGKSLGNMHLRDQPRQA